MLGVFQVHEALALPVIADRFEMAPTSSRTNPGLVDVCPT